MKRYYLIILSLFAVFSCNKGVETVELRPNIDRYQSEISGGSSQKTKVGIDTSATLFWNSGDKISVFTDYQNLQYSFTGAEGDVVGTFVYSSGYLDESAKKFASTYAIYPWEDSTTSVTGENEGVFSLTLPNVQYYHRDTFDPKSNFMAAAVSGIGENTLPFKNFCGYLVLQIYGAGSIKTLTLKGKNGEMLSGSASVFIPTSDEPEIEILETDDGGYDNLTLDCGEGVALTDDKESPVSFWFVIPPVKFSKGLEMEITTNDGSKVVKSTNISLKIERNSINRISPFRVENSSTDFVRFAVRDKAGKVYQAYDVKGPDITIAVPKGTDLTSLTPVFESNGLKVTLDNKTIVSGGTSVDFTDYINAKSFTVSGQGDSKTYNVKVVDTSLPVVYVSTPGHAAIEDKENWIESSTIFMEDEDGITDLGLTSIKGRGNFSWDYPPKNGYNLKLNKKKSVFGLDKNKRWRLMAGWFGLTNNAFYIELGRRCSIGWSPKGDYVELVLNGKWMGLYWLTQHMNIAEDRLNIAEMKPEDLTEPNITGGYLLEMDTNFDEDPKFETSSYKFPVMVSSHDVDSPTAQIDWIKNYLGEMESCLTDASKRNAGDFQEYIDMDSFCDYLFIMEIVEKWDFRHPRSVFLHKDRDGKLRMGPLWDMDYKFTKKDITGGWYKNVKFSTSSNSLDDNGWFFTHALYYNELMQSSIFKNYLSERWPEFKKCTEGMTTYLDGIADKISYSAERDYQLWKNVPLKQNTPWGWPSANRSFSSFSDEITNIKDVFNYNIDWIDKKLPTLLDTK